MIRKKAMSFAIYFYLYVQLGWHHVSVGLVIRAARCRNESAPLRPTPINFPTAARSSIIYLTCLIDSCARLLDGRLRAGFMIAPSSSSLSSELAIMSDHSERYAVFALPYHTSLTGLAVSTHHLPSNSSLMAKLSTSTPVSSPSIRSVWIV